ncbi:hypothetical protein COCC4DRAFT_150678 [Bipolaris maydis ATCC 48331]|uniref:Enoyl reductase (ER) domain-containing protein n=2 Tax=Cochliobolus heterostrophus TaxID=5016 RepID=M2TZ95_COCH5|nr:uncharacterized protein COCC4DRAFT_150678 [Bipolaris maydis ATCC 48331]EMD87171.1 hypothetical protein COCHEDRAFT_1033636 [Bipolaris maydis C5]ENI00434.1 hypothetical protein COCC4DRAFT_150678 [Bipolaris maydis ATCC 48331]KAJ6211794.1 hypothetical protein PSV09DRAFT_1033636 [Bipolaris maydis]KAJ6267275.1 hypothetical protein PSV08DRAFT_187832 [Bipolaris maydis]
MKCAVVVGPQKPIELWEKRVPPPAPGCVNVEVQRAGVCGTDIHLWEEQDVYLEPFILGHKGVGTIVHLGEGVTTDHAGIEVSPGDAVYWNPIRPCHSCYECTIERDLTGCKNGTLFSAATGSVTSDVPLDAFIALGCALPTMLKGLENLGPIQRGSNVLVQGCGAVGLASIMLARLAGAKTVICVDGNQSRMEMAERFGADEVLDIHSKDYGTAGAQGFSLAIEYSGRAAVVEEGLTLLAHNARYLLVGTWAGSGNVPLLPFDVVRKALKIIGITYESPENYYEAARIVETNCCLFPLADCVTHRFRLDQVQEAFSVVTSVSAIKAVIMPQEGFMGTMTLELHVSGTASKDAKVCIASSTLNLENFDREVVQPSSFWETRKFHKFFHDR